MNIYFKVGGVVLAVGLVIAGVLAWRSGIQAQTELKAELQTAKASLAELTARQSARDTTLNKALATLQHQKAVVQKPDQIIAALPGVLPLPMPLTLDQGVTTGNSGAASSPPAAPKLLLPAEDLKPLYDFAVDCKACQVRLATTKADLADEQAKTKLLGQERDAALLAAKGGSFWTRAKQAAKWFLIGAAAGAAASRLAR